ncbi:MAG: polysaccharide deacetylase family protein [Candidatus Poribacteria bacterium]|nr:polysaccharide deacetylase family protein [Candidatus Poribacteria bacterium]
MANRSDFPWPNGCHGTVSLTFDDGSQSQLDIAIPILKAYDLLGTFYINPRGEDWQQKLQPWRGVALAGHEVGNHTIQHICSRNFGWGRAKTLEDITLEEIETDVVEAERRLQALIPEQPVRTFCYPCYQSYVGEGPTRQSYVPVIARHFPAARGMGEAANHPELTDLHYLSASVVAGWMSGSDLCGLAAVAPEQSRWMILAFHSLQQEPSSGRHLGATYHGSALPADSFRELCEYLARHRDQIWTAPVVTVAQEIIAWRQDRRT